MSQPPQPERWLAFDAHADDADNLDVEPGNQRGCRMAWSERTQEAAMLWNGVESVPAHSTSDGAYSSSGLPYRQLEWTLSGANAADACISVTVSGSHTERRQAQ